LAESLKKEFDVEIEFNVSGGGVFEVTVDGDLVFSKKAEGRFPEDAEIIDAIKAKSPA